MHIYSKSLLMAALALTCSLSLVACGGGGGGGGETTSSDSSSNNNNNDNNNNNNNNNTTTTTDYAWSSGYRNGKLMGSIYDFHLYSNGTVAIKFSGTFHDATYTYSKTGTNTGRLKITPSASDSFKNQLNLDMTIEFTSSTTATITNTYAVGFYTVGNTTW